MRYSCHTWRRHAALLVGTILAAGALAASAEEVNLNWLASGATQKIGHYRPMRVTLSPDKPDGLKTTPADLEAPLYGVIRLGPAESPTTFYVVVDEPAGKPARLFVDANGNGDLTDDPPVKWAGRMYKAKDGTELTNCFGGADLQVAYGSEKLKLHVEMYRFDKRDPSRAALANALLYYRDFARSGEVSLGGKTYQAMLVDDAATGDFRPAKDAEKSGVSLLLDVNGNGKFESPDEFFDVAKPFNIGGTTYEITGISPSGGTFQVVKSSKTVEEAKPRPSLEKGHPAVAFEGKTTGGEAISFPKSYKGKLVMLDFWATWCPPCRGEVPYVSKAYERFHGKGFEVLGVSLDKANAAESLAKFTQDNNMPWPQIYDGQFWKAAVAQQYHVQSIPHAFLVDGDTGMIVAEGDALRGNNLAPAIEKALAKLQ